MNILFIFPGIFKGPFGAELGTLDQTVPISLNPAAGKALLSSPSLGSAGPAQPFELLGSTSSAGRADSDDFLSPAEVTTLI